VILTSFVWIQTIAGFYLEHDWGAIRITLVLWLGVLGGTMSSCTHDKTVVSTGSTAGLMGLLGAYIVDVFSNWQIYPRYKWRRYATIWATLVLVNIIMCTLGGEFNDVIAAIGGHGFGILVSMVLIPMEGERTAGQIFGQLAFIVVIFLLFTNVVHVCNEVSSSHTWGSR